MKVFADLHNHSKYSRATSPQMDLHWQTHYGKIKGLTLLGTGDFTHPSWFKELKQKLTPKEGGTYEHNGMEWVLSAEVSNIYSTSEGLKKVHHVLLAPSFEVVEQINELLGKKGKLEADGRPIFGKYTSEELVQDLKNISMSIEIIPSHIWTPWFGLFGSKSGYDNIKDCYGSQLKHIHCLETGLSSDPEMNWRVSQTHDFTLVSNSDSHSPWPLRLGRECNVLTLRELTYENLIRVLRSNELDFTVEVSPSYGKYHFDGHRSCNVCLHPEKSKKFNKHCPKCGRPLTIGVLSRVLELADRPEGFKPSNARPFKTFLPLVEVIRVGEGVSSPNSKRVLTIYEELVKHFGTEFNVLLEVPEKELLKKLSPKIVKMVLQNRSGTVSYEPVGHDGVYGEPVFAEARGMGKTHRSAKTSDAEEKSLKDFF